MFTFLDERLIKAMVPGRGGSQKLEKKIRLVFMLMGNLKDVSGRRTQGEKQRENETVRGSWKLKSQVAARGAQGLASAARRRRRTRIFISIPCERRREKEKVKRRFLSAGYSD